MVDKSLFIETLHEVAEIARTSTEPFTPEDIEKYFGHLELSKEQENMVYEYFNLPQDVRDYIPGQEEEDTPSEDEKGQESFALDDANETADAEDAEDEEAEEETMEEEVSVEQLSDSAYYRMYLEEVRGLKLDDNKTLLAQYQKLIDGDMNVIESIVENWLMHVIEMAKLYSDTPVNMEDVIQEGNMGLFLALSQVPADMQAGGMELYLIEQVKDSMENYIREMTGEEDQIQTVLAKSALLHQAQELLTKETGREPSLRELSEYTHIPAEEIQDILSLLKESQD